MNWRSAHGFPLDSVQIVPRNKVRRFSSGDHPADTTHDRTSSHVPHRPQGGSAAASRGGRLQRDLGEQVHLGRIGDGGVQDQLVHADRSEAGDGLLDRLG